MALMTAVRSVCSPGSQQASADQRSDFGVSQFERVATHSLAPTASAASHPLGGTCSTNQAALKLRKDRHAMLSPQLLEKRLPFLEWGATSVSQIAVSTASTWQKNGRTPLNW
jgi:hypothetical protein